MFLIFGQHADHMFFFDIELRPITSKCFYILLLVLYNATVSRQWNTITPYLRNPQFLGRPIQGRGFAPEMMGAIALYFLLDYIIHSTEPFCATSSVQVAFIPTVFWFVVAVASRVVLWSLLLCFSFWFEVSFLLLLVRIAPFTLTGSLVPWCLRRASVVLHYPSQCWCSEEDDL